MNIKEESEIHNLFQVEYEKNLNDHYLIIKNEQDEEDNYQVAMLIENRIPYFLPLEIRSIDGRNDLYYRISSLQPIGKIYKNREINLEDVKNIVMGLTKALMTAQEYMLEEKHVVLLPEYIFMHTKDRQIQILFNPYFNKEIEESLRELADYLIVKIDHSDQDAVMMGYQFCRTVREDNFVIDDIAALYTEKYKNVPEDVTESDWPVESRKEYDRSFDIEYQEEQKNLINSHNGIDKKVPSLIKKIIPVILAVISGVLLFGGIGPYHPDNMEKVILGILFLISVLGIGMEIIQIFLKKSESELLNSSDIREHSMKSKNNYDNIFADMQKQDPYVDQNIQITKDDLEEDNQRKLQDDIQNNTEKNMKKEEIYGKTVILTTDSQMAENILIETKRGKETKHYIESFPYTIGKVKDHVDLALSDISVSRIHARIIEENGQIYVQDCNSTNGTYVNGILLDKEEKIPIERDDEIGIGRITLLYQ